jgi:hypothetical protein
MQLITALTRRWIGTGHRDQRDRQTDSTSYRQTDITSDRQTSHQMDITSDRQTDITSDRHHVRQTGRHHIRQTDRRHIRQTSERQTSLQLSEQQLQQEVGFDNFTHLRIPQVAHPLRVLIAVQNSAE